MFHDLLHTFKTHARKAGIDRNVRMVMMGHTDGNDMDLRYDTVDEGDLRDAVDRLGLFFQNSDQTVTKGTKKGLPEQAQK